MILSDELAREAAEAYKAHGSKRAAAMALNLPRKTFCDRLNTAAQRGMLGFSPVLPGFVVKETSTGPEGKQWVRQVREPGAEFAVPEGHMVKGVSALVDPDGRTLAKWVKTRSDSEFDPIALAAALKEAFADYAPVPAPIALTDEHDKDILTFIPLADFHIGMYGWKSEVGENWDLKIAEHTIGSALDDLISRAPPGQDAIILGGGDLLHSDSNENKTARSGAILQVDGRYPKTVITACKLVVRTIDAALRRYNNVQVRMLPGNHDEHATVAVAYFLLAWYRNEPRVAVDADPSLFWWHRFGRVMLGATHGHTVKILEMPQIMAHRRAEDWGLTKYRYIHGFHLHHKAQFATEGGGCVSEIHQAPIPQDAWHYGSGYLSGRSVQAITYHREFGEIGRVRVAMMDGQQ